MNLFQLSTVHMAEFCAGSAKIMRSKLIQLHPLRAPSDDDRAIRTIADQLPDIDVTSPERDTNIMTLHGHSADRDIYFVSNQVNRPQDVAVTCRVQGMAPEIWHATSGMTEPVSYRSNQNGVSIPLHLDPEGSVFVVFHKSATRSRTVPNVTMAVLQTLTGPWNLAFQPGWGAPKI